MISPLLLGSLFLLLLSLVEGHTLPQGVKFKGINLSAAEWKATEWGGGIFPGTHGKEFKWPIPSYNYTGFTYFEGKGMNIVRLPFRWERLQPNLASGSFDQAEFTRMKTTVRYYTSRGVTVFLDMHNYMRYYQPGASPTNDIAIIGQSSTTAAHFAQAWRLIATEFKGEGSKVIFALMNEPHDIDLPTYYRTIQGAVTAIRSTGATNYIAVMGGGWGSAWWYYLYRSQADQMLASIKDPNGKILFDVHMYLNIDTSGGTPDCVSKDVGQLRTAFFTNWLKANNQIGILSEIGAGSGSLCQVAIDRTLTHVEHNAQYYAGYIWWDANVMAPGSGSNLDLAAVNGVDRPQMNTLEPHIKWEVGDYVNYQPPSTACPNTIFSRCGGSTFTGATCCPEGFYCRYIHYGYGDCQPLGMETKYGCTKVAGSPCDGGSTSCCPSTYGCRFTSATSGTCQKIPIPTSPAPAPAPTCVAGIGGQAQCGGKLYPASAPTTCCGKEAYCKFGNIYWSDCQWKPSP